ncbi:hypothetical protein NE852_06580 [Rhizobium sp. Pop5]|uniref:hypothetical protein n=1 Tax=Rhizobium sp. Pop5 TaxID=1223565 RepID=UPI000FFB6424|nr:hypothetical protein [Rhizobium sp. Pop5]UVD57865.1 hypothetical protein NE852_06580 [Rhizobium sp. Pop5]
MTATFGFSVWKTGCRHDPCLKILRIARRNGGRVSDSTGGNALFKLSKKLKILCQLQASYRSWQLPNRYPCISAQFILRNPIFLFAFWIL